MDNRSCRSNKLTCYMRVHRNQPFEIWPVWSGKRLEVLADRTTLNVHQEASFAVIKSASLDEAIAKVSNDPCSVALGVVEVWPLK